MCAEDARYATGPIPIESLKICNIRDLAEILRDKRGEVVNSRRLWPVCHIFVAHLPHQVAKRPGRTGRTVRINQPGLKLKLQNAGSRRLTDRFLVHRENESSR